VGFGLVNSVTDQHCCENNILNVEWMELDIEGWVVFVRLIITY